MDSDVPGIAYDATHVEAAYAVCQAITKSGASNFYYAFRTLPKEKRQAIYATYAFCRVCDDAVDAPSHGDDPAHRLNRLRSLLNHAFDGRPEGDIWIALADVRSRYPVTDSHFRDVLDGVEMDLTRTRYETFEELLQYCRRVASAVGLICIEVCGYAHERAVRHASDFGIAMQLTNILRDIGEDARSGRIYLPQEDLERFGYRESDLMAGTINDRFQALMAFQIDRVRAYFERGSLLLPLLDRRSRACPAAMQAGYSRLIDCIERVGYNVFDHRVSLSKRVKLAMAGRLWLQSRIPLRA